MNILSEVRNRMTSVGDEFISFLVDKNIPTSMAAVTIAFSTGTFIRSLSSDIVIPLLYSFLPLDHLTTAFHPISRANIDNFIKEFVSFVLVLILTFVILNYIFGMITKKKADKEKRDKADKEKGDKAKSNENARVEEDRRIRIHFGDDINDLSVVDRGNNKYYTNEAYENYYPF